MQCLGEQLLYITSRIVGQTKDGVSTGTGFFFSHDDRIFLVTNKHVVKDVSAGSFVMLKSEMVNDEERPKHGEKIEVFFKESDFVGHPDDSIDIAVMNISSIYNNLFNSGTKPYIKLINSDFIPDKEAIDKFISPIEDVLFVGYPSGIWDSKNYLPIMRKGTTATPYYIDFMGEQKFLIDASVFPGSSGSPVFMYYSGSYPDKDGTLYPGSMLKFFGIVASVYYRQDESQIIVKDIPTNNCTVPVSTQMINLGVVFKPKTIIDTINFYLSLNPLNTPIYDYHFGNCSY